jgi:hypothetical protein
VQQQLTCQVIGLGMMAALPQLIYEGLGLLYWNPVPWVAKARRQPTFPAMLT